MSTRHDPQLIVGAPLFLFQKGTAVLDVDVVPRKAVVQLIGRMDHLLDVDPGVPHCLPPPLSVEMLMPTVQPCTAPPGGFDGTTHPAIAATQNALQQTRLDVVAFDLNASQ